MAGRHDGTQHLVEIVFNVDDNHLRTGNHDIPNLSLGYLEHAGEHALFFSIEFNVGLYKSLDFVAAPGFALDRAHHARNQSGCT